MSDPFLAEIRFFGFNFAPQGWAFCNGQTLPIAQNSALYSLVGTNYGGNGTSNFALPNLQGSAACSAGSGAGLSARSLGQAFGTPGVTLQTAELASHRHTFSGRQASSSQLADSPTAGSYLSRTLNQSNFTDTNVVDTTLSPQTIGPAGTGGAHENRQPYLTLNACIALQGIYPQRP